MLKDRIGELKAARDQARLDAERAEDAIERAGSTITPQQPAKECGPMAATARDHLCALSNGSKSIRKRAAYTGSKIMLLRTLAAASSEKTEGFGVPSSVPKWRTRHDSNV